MCVMDTRRKKLYCGIRYNNLGHGYQDYINLVYRGHYTSILGIIDNKHTYNVK